MSQSVDPNPFRGTGGIRKALPVQGPHLSLLSKSKQILKKFNKVVSVNTKNRNIEWSQILINKYENCFLTKMNETKDVVYAGVDNGVVLVVGVEDPVLPFHGGGGEVHQQLSGVLWVGHSGGSVDFIKGAVGIGGSVVDSHNSFI